MKEDWTPLKGGIMCKNQRVLLHIWPSWLISALTYHEDHYKELQKYNCLSLLRWWYAQPRAFMLTPRPGGSRGRNPQD